MKVTIQIQTYHINKTKTKTKTKKIQHVMIIHVEKRSSILGFVKFTCAYETVLL